MIFFYILFEAAFILRPLFTVPRGVVLHHSDCCISNLLDAAAVVLNWSGGVSNYEEAARELSKILVSSNSTFK